MIRFKTILFPTDFSAPSEYAFRVACSLARDHKARLLILHAAPPVLAYGEATSPPPAANYADRLWESFRKLQASEPALRELRVDTEVTEGDPVDAILSAARENNCDLIVMGTHGRTGLSRVLLGSVAELVLRKATCPVLTIKASGNRAEESDLSPEDTATLSGTSS